MSPAERWVVVAFLWTLFAVQLGRSLLRSVPQTAQGWRVWAIFGLGCMTLTLWGESVDAALEAQFDGLPLGVYLKCSALLLAAHLEIDIIATVEPTILDNRWIRSAAPAALTIATLLLVLAARNQWSLSDYGRLAVIAVRDAVLALYIAALFLPALLRLVAHEQNPTMRFRHAASAAFSASYLPVATGNLVVFVLATAHSPLTERAQALFHPLIYACALLFAGMYLPRSLIARLVRLRLTVDAWRVRRIARTIAEQTGQPPEPIMVSWVQFVLGQGDLPAQIYRDVLFILDHAPRLPEGSRLRARVARLEGTALDAEQIARELVRC